MDGLTSIIFDLLIDIGLGENLTTFILSFVSVLIWILIGILLNIIIKKTIVRTLKATADNQRAVTVGKLLSSVVRYVLWFVIFVIVLGEMNVNIAPILASAGVVGLAVGFGAQEIVKDFISGFFIIFEGSFNVGDVIEVNGFKGNVMSLGLRTTSIKNWKGEIMTVNNGDLKGVTNFSKNDSIAIIDFSVAYDTDLNKFNKLMNDFVKQINDKYNEIVEMPNFVGISELGESSINMKLFVKTKAMKHFQVERDIRKDLIELCNLNNIEIPFPQVVVRNA